MYKWEGGKERKNKVSVTAIDFVGERRKAALTSARVGLNCFDSFDIVVVTICHQCRDRVQQAVDVRNAARVAQFLLQQRYPVGEEDQGERRRERVRVGLSR